MREETHLPPVQDHDPVTVQHSVEAMGDHESGAAPERGANHVLYEAVCLGVNSSCCLV